MLYWTTCCVYSLFKREESGLYVRALGSCFISLCSLSTNTEMCLAAKIVVNILILLKTKDTCTSSQAVFPQRVWIV